MKRVFESILAFQLHVSMKFSAIIPAYNEWPRIISVLTTVLNCSSIWEVIVIDDGSTDSTRENIETLSHPKLKKIFLPTNIWKAWAVIRGVESTHADYIVMIDSDLIGLTPEHINSLITPIKNRECDVTLSIRENSLEIYKMLWSDFVSGERVLPRSVFNDREFFLGRGFGLEVKINSYIRRHKLKIKNIYLIGLVTPRKSEKFGWYTGTKKDIAMLGDIIRSVGSSELVKQLWYFSRFSKN